VAQVGWPELAAQVATLADDLSPVSRPRAVIVTQTYGEYGALKRTPSDAASQQRYRRRSEYS
jgi:hypothetical protein